MELSDLINCSPSLNNARTPGQLLSLTSHLSFGSCEKKNITNQSQITSNLMHAMNRQSNQMLSSFLFLFLSIKLYVSESPEHELDTSMVNHQKSHDDSHVSGVSPFQSADDIQFSLPTKHEEKIVEVSVHLFSAGIFFIIVCYKIDRFCIIILYVQFKRW